MSHHDATQADHARRSVGAKNCNAIAVVPWHLRVLLCMTTAPASAAPCRAATVNTYVTELIADGFVVRAADWRNFLLWRNGTTLRTSKIPVIVLPSATISLAEAHRTILVIAELMQAVARVRKSNARDKWHLAEIFRSEFSLSFEDGAAQLERQRPTAERHLLMGGYARNQVPS